MQPTAHNAMTGGASSIDGDESGRPLVDGLVEIQRVQQNQSLAQRLSALCHGDSQAAHRNSVDMRRDMPVEISAEP
jgi:hypothetical protein